MMKKTILLFVIIFQLANLYSQNEYYNHLKYWYYRNRFKKYFVKIGDCQGCSIPSDCRNDALIDWGKLLFGLDYTYTIEADDAKPYIFKAFNTIETNATIDTKVHNSNYSANTNGTNRNGHVTMVAGKRIHLKPGFRVKKGAYFHGYIQNLDICSGNFKNCDSIITQNEFIPIEYNDVSPMPGYDEVHLRIDSLYKNSAIIQDSISNSVENPFYIYPNPGNGLFSIQSKLTVKNYRVLVVNDMGSIILQNTANYTPFTIDISNQPSGIYFIIIETETEVYNLKYIKK